MNKDEIISAVADSAAELSKKAVNNVASALSEASKGGKKKGLDILGSKRKKGSSFDPGEALKGLLNKK